MKVQRYFAPDMRQALRMVRERQGPDVVILSNRKVDGGVELITAEDYDQSMWAPQAPPQEPSEALGRAVAADQPKTMEQAATPLPAASNSAPSAPRPRIDLSAGPEVLWTGEQALEQVRSELRDLRGLLQQQVAGLAWGELGRRHPLGASLLRKLVVLGLSPALGREIVEDLPLQSDPLQGWRQCLALLARRIPVDGDSILRRGGVVALVGPSGAGKTTVIAKLATRYVLEHGPEHVALLTTDNHRVGAQTQLRSFGKIIGVPVWSAGSGEELDRALEQVCDRRLVLIDTAGLSHRDRRLSEQLELLQSGGRRARIFLVLSATTQHRDLEQVVASYRPVSPAGCIITKLDEAMSLGPALSVAAGFRLPVTYVSDGQRVPEDLSPAKAHSLVSRAVALAGREPEDRLDELLETAFQGEALHAAH